MKKFKRILPFLFLFISLFLDRHLTYFLSTLLSYQFVISSHFFLMMLLFFILTYSKYLVYFIFLILSFLYDSLYFHGIGISTFLFPLLIFLGYKWLPLMNYSKIARVLSFFILVFIFNIGSYFLALFYHMTSYSFDVFVVYHLLPSLMINLLFYFFSDFFVNRLHLI
ncbi:rod shape-determining protein MreD [Streptococcus marimammalium]|uniref:rod shape-determining protein MreD n=1 Tax=Streptococcus marimammalium TaxID=269666 RepID=UPI00037BFFD6